jgi:hypothetical protein
VQSQVPEPRLWFAHEISPYYTFNVQQELQRKGLRPLRNP